MIWRQICEWPNSMWQIHQSSVNNAPGLLNITLKVSFPGKEWTFSSSYSVRKWIYLFRYWISIINLIKILLVKKSLQHIIFISVMKCKYFVNFSWDYSQQSKHSIQASVLHFLNILWLYLCYFFSVLSKIFRYWFSFLPICVISIRYIGWSNPNARR